MATELPAAHSVANALAEIVLTELSPGASLPSEAELATRFAVSRLTVREAVKMVAGRGLLDLGRGRRAIVREPDGSAFGDFLFSVLRNDPKGLFDLIELRMSLETQAASLAAKRGGRAALQGIEAALEAMRLADAEEHRPGGDPVAAEAQFHSADVRFHEAVALASGNRVIGFIFEAMTRPLREAFHMSRHGQSLRGAGRQETILAHAAVYEAIRDGDSRRSAEAMRRHLRDTELDIRSHIASRRPPA